MILRNMRHKTIAHGFVYIIKLPVKHALFPVIIKRKKDVVVRLLTHVFNNKATRYALMQRISLQAAKISNAMFRFTFVCTFSNFKGA